MRATAEREAQTILAQTRQEAGELRSTAAQDLLKASSESKDIREQAGMKARVLQTQADNLLLNATKEATHIVATANERAEEIAGEALAAARNAAGLEKTIQALKNNINGYGGDYLIPSYTLLDELAADFGHLEAGEELKKARERTRLMVRSRTAAKCGYVEAVRSTSAENFVADAFNGKVDTILTNVKHDNYGTLAQQIKDAFALVNNLGKPFKDAHITPEYLAARLDELRWATLAHELRLNEREEQRQIREQIREEEKARREFEKAQRDAAKQEETIQKTIDRVQQQAAKASEAQREAFEAQLLELQGKLQMAQEKNQRALSMAQQTKSGHVYVISNIGSFGEHVYKIGMTRRLEPLDPVLSLVLSDADQFENGEERRLFYVALTRAKERVILVADRTHKSKFITELEAGSAQESQKKCPLCITADAVLRTGNKKNGEPWAFYGCSNHQYGCEYQEWVRQVPSAAPNPS